MECEVASEGLEKFVVLKLFKLLGLRLRGLLPQTLTMPMYQEGSFFLGVFQIILTSSTVDQAAVSPRSGGHPRG